MDLVVCGVQVDSGVPRAAPTPTPTVEAPTVATLDHPALPTEATPDHPALPTEATPGQPDRTVDVVDKP